MTPPQLSADELDAMLSEVPAAVSSGEFQLLVARVRALEAQLDAVEDRERDAEPNTAYGPLPLDHGSRLRGSGGVHLVLPANGAVGAHLDPMRLGFSARLGPVSGVDSEILLRPTDDQGWVPMVDVLHLDTRLGRRGRVRLGRMHNPLSWWLSELPIDAFGMTADSVPRPLRPEWENGLLPVHTVGVDTSALLPVDVWSVGVGMTAHNGRHPEPSRIAETGAGADIKAVSARIWGESGDGFHLGLAGGYDRVEPVQSDQERVTELTGGAHFGRVGALSELVLEGFLIGHQRPGETAAISPTGYAHFGYDVARSRPYVGFSLEETSADDPWAGQIGDDVRVARYRLGVRRAFGAQVAAKGEISWVERGSAAVRQRLSVGLVAAF